MVISLMGDSQEILGQNFLGQGNPWLESKLKNESQKKAVGNHFNIIAKKNHNPVHLSIYRTRSNLHLELLQMM